MAFYIYFGWYCCCCCVTVVSLLFLVSSSHSLLSYLAAFVAWGNQFLPPLHTHTPKYIYSAYYCLWRAILQNVSIMMVRFHNSIQFTQAHSFTPIHIFNKTKKKRRRRRRRRRKSRQTNASQSQWKTFILCMQLLIYALFGIVNAFGVINASIINDNEIISIA